MKTKYKKHTKNDVEMFLVICMLKQDNCRNGPYGLKV